MLAVVAVAVAVAVAVVAEAEGGAVVEVEVVEAVQVEGAVLAAEEVACNCRVGCACNGAMQMALTQSIPQTTLALKRRTRVLKRRSIYAELLLFVLI